jgi:MoaA/NifB/PqqE/SkfB family radical SAM enzyme
MITQPLADTQTTPDFLWLDLTRKCQLNCLHCYNASGPDGTHGTMTREGWLSILDQAAACGVRAVQFIGGEPTLHPDATELADHALSIGLEVEVFSNLVHVSAAWWKLFRRNGVRVATSYYSDRAEVHDAKTGRPSHARTRSNIEKAVSLGVALRVGVIGNDEQRLAETRRDLEALGVTRIGVDHVRPFGRGGQGQESGPDNLCGRCGIGKAAIDPAGRVSPCVFSGWLAVGNVHDAPLATILGGTEMAEANATIRRATRTGKCRPDDDTPCVPEQLTSDPCAPEDYEECSPGYPPSECSPRGG